MDGQRVVIVGAGHAGTQAALSLRQFGFSGPITLLSAEAEPPYERPPLSKAYLVGACEAESLRFRDPEFYASREIELRLDQCVTGVDAVAHRVETADGGCFGYGTLIWAAGGQARALGCEGAAHADVLTLRSRADAAAIRAGLDQVETVAVIGAGYIGLEVAASLRKLGKAVTVLEAADRVLARVAGPAVSEFFAAHHRAHGVTLHLGASVVSVLQAEDRVRGVQLASGAVVAAERVIVGIGIIPSVGPLRAAGAAGENGVRVDAYGRTSLADVYAIGDCAFHPNRFAPGGWARLESVQNAADQAVVVAKALCGQPVAYDTVPWFWSNQYELRLQTVGIASGADGCVRRGEPERGGGSFVYTRDGRVVALDCINAPRDFVQGKALVAAGAVLDPARLVDASLPLKTLVVG